jgi:hypothetical protein
MDAAYRSRWEKIFRENIKRRSRSASGRQDQGTASPMKKPTLRSGDELAAQVWYNTGVLIESVAGAVDVTLRGEPLTAQVLRLMCEQWFDVVNDGLSSAAQYANEIGELKALIGRTALARFACPLELNSRYRLWTPAYLGLQIPPAFLVQVMERFYEHAVKDVLALRGKPFTIRDVAVRLAEVDLIMDAEVHPWRDGCGRVTTALIMWVSGVLEVAPPLFAETYEGHIATYGDSDAHKAYLMQCLERGAAYVPAP